MEIKHKVKEIIQVPKEVEVVKGTAYTLIADDKRIEQYAEGVERFLTDNKPKMGDNWVENIASRLYNPLAKNKQGELTGSSTDIGVAYATFCQDFNLITGQQLLKLYLQAGNKNPFGDVYIDFGVLLNGNQTNPVQADLLLNEFSHRGINLEKGRVPDLVQLRLVANQESGLAYKLKEDVVTENVAFVSDYPFNSTYVGKNGLFRACLNRDGDWDTYVGILALSGDYGRVVCYDAEGVAPKKSERNIITDLTQKFRERLGS